MPTLRRLARSVPVTDESLTTHGAGDALRYRLSVGEAVPELDQMLSHGERRGNEFPPARELTVQILDEEGISPPA